MSMDASRSGIQLVDEDDAPLNSTINTTPLVDIMLVLLIIFLITVPVVVSTIPLELPEERNRAVITRPENINISIDSDGTVYINTRRVDEEQLAAALREAAFMNPQPEVHIRGDLTTQYLNVGKVVETAQRSGILRIGFITKEPPRE
jgi:biopolymer transport protein ExbD